MNEVKALIFDKDGTLFDFAATWGTWATSFLMRMTEGDAGRASEVGEKIGFNLATQEFSADSVVIANTSGDVAEALHPYFANLTRSALLDVLNQEAEKAPQRQAVPLIPLLTGLREGGLRLGVATNDAERPARAHLDQAGVTGLFDFVAGYDSGFGGKPAPGQLLAFAGQMELHPSQVVMIGDSTHDLHAGRAAGMTAIGVLTGIATQAMLAPHADAVLPDIGALPNWLAARQA